MPGKVKEGSDKTPVLKGQEGEYAMTVRPLYPLTPCKAEDAVYRYMKKVRVFLILQDYL